MPNLDYDFVRTILEREFQTAEQAVFSGASPDSDNRFDSHFDIIFSSKTQAPREVLLGCVLARLSDRSIDITKPYVNLGDDAFNGRTLDEKVVNPFFHEKRVPSSRGPYLSMFRRSVRFDKSTRKGVRDKSAFDAFLALVSCTSQMTNENDLLQFLRMILHQFLNLRSESNIPLSKLQRISLEQYDALITGLLATPSGGRFPMLLIEATFCAIKEAFNLTWTIDVQGINVADGAAKAGGDIEIQQDGEIVLAAEVTERPVEKNRVRATFQTKIAPHGIEDYLFFVTAMVNQEAMQQARQYFSQGHEVNFLSIKNYIIVTLTSIGKKGREAFNRILTERLEGSDVPAEIKVAWNDQIFRITST